MTKSCDKVALKRACDLILFSLAVGGTQVRNGDVLVTVAGVRVQFPSGQKRVILNLRESDGFLRAVLDASKTEFAIAGGLDRISFQNIVAARTHIHAYSALDTSVSYDKILLAAFEETNLGVNACVCDESVMLHTFLLRCRLNPVFSLTDFSLNL